MTFGLYVGIRESSQSQISHRAFYLIHEFGRRQLNRFRWCSFGLFGNLRGEGETMQNTTPSTVVFQGPHGETLIQKTPDVCGGDACIRNSRIMVWLLVSWKKGGWTDQDFFNNYDSLTFEDLNA